MKICPNCKNEFSSSLCPACWPEKKCDNCGEISHTLASRKICPYCDKELFIESLIEGGFPWEFDGNKKNDPGFTQKMNDKIKNRNINITKKELNNIRLLKTAFKTN